jgi:hypothetical protein
MRPWEVDTLRQRFPDVAAKYQVDKIFEMPGVPEKQLNEDRASGVAFGGLTEVNLDMKFVVLKKSSP